MTRRRGLSLVEVLVALFIMGLGAIAILTLFPLGALQMGQALKDDRTAQSAGQADSYMRWYWKRYIVDDDAATNSPNRLSSAPAGVLEPFIRAMEDPNDDSSYDAGIPLLGIAPVVHRFAPYYTNFPVQPNPNGTPWFPNPPGPQFYTPPQGFQKRYVLTLTTNPPAAVPGSGLYPLRPLYASQYTNYLNRLGPHRPIVESGPSYPVIVDPIGCVNFEGQQDKFWVANTPIPAQRVGGKIARRTLSAIPPLTTDVSALPTTQGGTLPPLGWRGMDGTLANQAQRTCSLLDGITYDQNGVPDLSTGAVQREMRYNWLWVLQKLHQNDDHTATMTIVVFDKRAFQFVPPGAEQLYSPATSDAAGRSLLPIPSVQNQQPLPAYKIGTTLVRFPRGASPPVIKGGWIADVTHTTWTYPEPQPPDANGNVVILYPTISAVRNCNFYRVVSITDNVADGTVDMELQTPLKPDSMTLFDPHGKTIDNADQAAIPLPNRTNQGGLLGSLYGTNPNPPQVRTFMYLAGVSEVFERLNLTRNLGP